MPRPKSKAPVIQYHLSGNSVVRLDGRDFYLGKHQSAESFARYAVLIRLYQENGCRLPESVTMDDIDRQVVFPSPVENVPQRQDLEPIRVEHVTQCFLKYFEESYRDQPKEIYRIKKLATDIESFCGSLPVEQFGPVKLQALRQTFVDAGLARVYCNKLTNHTARMFKHAVGQELISQEIWQRLKAVEPLRAGRTKAHETDDREPVSLELVQKTAMELTPILRDMLRLLVATGLRPKEVCTLRPCDIDRTDSEIWWYKPRKHKTSNQGVKKAIPLIGDARSVVEDYINRNAESYLFSPAENVNYVNAQKRANRKSKVQPSQRDRSKVNPKKKPREHYDTQSFGQSVKRASQRAGVEWTLYQIRHLVGTQVTDALGIETASKLLGHTETRTTQRYSKTAQQQALNGARVTPKL